MEKAIRNKIESLRDENHANRSEAMRVLVRMKKIERSARMVKVEEIASGVKITYKINNKKK